MRYQGKEEDKLARHAKSTRTRLAESCQLSRLVPKLTDSRLHTRRYLLRGHLGD